MSHRLKTVSLPEEAHVILEAQPKQTQSKYVADAIIMKEIQDEMFKGNFANCQQEQKMMFARYKKLGGKDLSFIGALKAELELRRSQL